MKDFPVFPWERDEKPYFINEIGYEWYVDKFATQWAHEDVCLSSYHTRKGIKNVIAFFVKNGDDIRSILIDDKQEIITEAETTIGLCNKIDKLKIYYDFATFDDLERDREAKKYLMEVCHYISE